MPEKQWSDAARRWLRQMQQHAYGILARQAGRPVDPAGARDWFQRPKAPWELIGPKRFKTDMIDRFGLDEGSDEYLREFERYRTFYEAPLPTPYEDPNLYMMLLEMADSIEQTIREHDLPVHVFPLLGTLPLGQINAQTHLVPGTDEYVVLFEHGLFVFISFMVRIVARL